MTCDGTREPFYDQCYSYTSKEFIIHECRPGKVCESDYFNNVSSLATINVTCLDIYETYNCNGTGTLTSGRRCCSDTDCNTGTCANLVCTRPSSCQEHEDCSSGTYCNNGNCLPSGLEGSSCKDDAECKAGFGCNYDKCTKLLSLDDGSEAEDNKFCQSNYTYLKKCESVLVYVNRTLIPSPFECFVTKDMCNYTLTISNTSIAYEPCICAGKNNTLGYCSRWVVLTSSYAKKMHKFLDYDKSNCGGKYKSTTNPDVLLECGSISKKDYIGYKKAWARGRFWNLEQSGLLEECGFILDIFDPNASFAGFLIVSFGIIFLTG
jgi:hypothetical protein